ncbi:MAG: hypothetical protein K0M40_14175 [Prolixibacteraceae bacterium]|nr:hypothetical protein [Prolixibacteraceae bacterium]
MAKIKVTGYWTFFCNPKYWAIDEFLSNIEQDYESEYRITSWQKDFFFKGQLGVIRVGNDARTKLQLGGREKLKKGIYAIVEILGTPYLQIESESNFKINHQKGETSRYIVPIKYQRNYILNPILLESIQYDYVIKSDPYLLKGIQAASMPLSEDALNRILLYGEKDNVE